MTDSVLNLTAENRKKIYRTSRLLIWSFILAIATAAVFFSVNPFAFWNPSLHLIIVVALWVAFYHGLEWLRKR